MAQEMLIGRLCERVRQLETRCTDLERAVADLLRDRPAPGWRGTGGARNPVAYPEPSPEGV